MVALLLRSLVARSIVPLLLALCLVAALLVSLGPSARPWQSIQTNLFAIRVTGRAIDGTRQSGWDPGGICAEPKDSPPNLVRLCATAFTYGGSPARAIPWIEASNNPFIEQQILPVVLKEADDSWAKADWQSAAAYYEIADYLSPGQLRTTSRHFGALLLMRDYDGAEAFLKSLDDERHAEYSPAQRHVWWGDLYEAEGDRTRAEQFYSDVSGDSEAEAQAHERLAGFAIQRKDFAAAIEQYKEVASHRPSDYTAYALIGNLYSNQLNRPDLAIPYLQKAADTPVASNVPGVLLKLAEAYSATGQDSLALPVLTKVLQLRAEDSVACLLAQTYSRVGDLAAAGSVLASTPGIAGKCVIAGGIPAK